MKTTHFPTFSLRFLPRFGARHGSLQGEAMAVGSWRVALHPMELALPGPRGEAEMELFVVGATATAARVGEGWEKGGESYGKMVVFHGIDRVLLGILEGIYRRFIGNLDGI